MNRRLTLKEMFESELTEKAVNDPNVKQFGNLGDMAEAILGAAIVAKFKTPKSQVTTASIIEILNQLPKITKSYSQSVVRQVLRVSSTKNDDIIFTIGLATINYMSLHNQEAMNRANGILQSAALFANSTQVSDYALKAYNDPKKNIINISSIGTENQKGTKVDLKVDYDGQIVPWGKLSLKAGGTKQLGQIGKGWEAGVKASRGIVDLFRGLFGIELDSSLRAPYAKAIGTGTYEDAVKVIQEVYWDAYQKISDRFDGGPKELQDFLSTLASGIRYEAYLDEQGITLLQLGNNTFKTMDFNKLVQIMKDENLNVEIEVNYNKEGQVPKLYMNLWIDGEAYGPIVSVRPKIRKNEKTGGIGEFRHYVEKEAGLVKLINTSHDYSSQEI